MSSCQKGHYLRTALQKGNSTVQHTLCHAHVHKIKYSSKSHVLPLSGSVLRQHCAYKRLLHKRCMHHTDVRTSTMTKQCKITAYLSHPRSRVSARTRLTQKGCKRYLNLQRCYNADGLPTICSSAAFIIHWIFLKYKHPEFTSHYQEPAATGRMRGGTANRNENQCVTSDALRFIVAHAVASCM